MIFDLLKDALAEFKQKFPEIAEKLNNPKWAAENNKRTEKLKRYKGRGMLEIPAKDKSLRIREVYYELHSCEKDGMFAAGKNVSSDPVPQIHIKGINFFNPVVVEQHLQILESRQTLEEIVKEDPSFKTKMSVVFGEEWKSFLGNSGFDVDHYSTFDLKRFTEEASFTGRTLVNPLVRERVDAAYALITQRTDDVRPRKERFAEQFPDFEEVVADLNKNRYRELIDHRGWWLKKDFDELDSSTLFRYRSPGDIVSDETARKAISLRDRINSATFKKYVQLLKEHPDLKEKIDYIKEHKNILLPADYQRIHLNNILEMPRKRITVRGRGRFARTRERESNREYDERIVDTINHVYELLQKRENEPQQERPAHQQERIKQWLEKGRKTDKIARFVDHVLEKANQQDWYTPFQELVNGFRFPGDYRVNTSNHWSRQNIGFYVSAGTVKGEWGWNMLVSGSEERFDTPGAVHRQLRDDREEKYVPVAAKFEALVNECIVEFYTPKQDT